MHYPRNHFSDWVDPESANYAKKYGMTNHREHMAAGGRCTRRETMMNQDMRRFSNRSFEEHMTVEAAQNPPEDFDYMEMLRADQLTDDIKKNHTNFVQDRKQFARTPVALDTAIETVYSSWQGLGTRGSMPRVRDGARSVSSVDQDDYERNSGVSISNWRSGCQHSAKRGVSNTPQLNVE